MGEQVATPPVGKKRHAFSWLTDANYFSVPSGYVTYFIKSQLKALPEPKADFTGQVVIVTGANVGLGLEAARHFARLGAAKVILACRDLAKAEAARAHIIESLASSSPSDPSPGGGVVVEAWQVDLGSFESVRGFCARASRELPRLDVLVENAAVAIGSYVERDGGFESTIAVNVVGTMLMAILLLPLMRRTAASFPGALPHLSVVSSDAHNFAKFAERSHRPTVFAAFKGAENMNEDRYNLSKLLVVLLVRELAARVGGGGGQQEQQQQEQQQEQQQDQQQEQQQDQQQEQQQEQQQQKQQKQEQDKTPIVINTLNPGLCRSSLFRHAPFPLSLIVGVGLLLLGRTTEMGSRTLVAAASAGRESHGRYMDCCAVRDESAFARSEEGRELQGRLWAELMALLDEMEPGIETRLTAVMPA